MGSRPPPTISWRLGDTLINELQTRLETSNDNNVTTSTISLLAESDHHGKTISCIAGVPGLSNSTMEATRSLNIHFISSAKLSLGSTMRLGEVKEGDDVYLECEVESNPRPDRVIWLKNVSDLMVILGWSLCQYSGRESETRREQGSDTEQPHSGPPTCQPDHPW